MKTDLYINYIFIITFAIGIFNVFHTRIYAQANEDKAPLENTTIVRGPYLQSGTEKSIILRWQTNNPTDSRVIYGISSRSHIETAINPLISKDHKVEIEHLKKHTKYYYSIGDSKQMFNQGDSSYYFITSPSKDYKETVHMWVIGDFGTGDELAESVKNGYMKYRRGLQTDVWLMLGDIAYYHGEDKEYQKAIFSGIYKPMLRSVVAWPTPGNHDLRSADSHSQTGPYYEIFTLPTQGQAGGIPSDTEAYYSFNYGNIHYISLDSEDTPRDAGSSMLTWLEEDLKESKSLWNIVFFHHPPYTKGTHDSDREIDSRGRMIEVRENILPILEKYGVDLVLSGHSHVYERSFLLKNHYGYSSTFNSKSMIIKTEGKSIKYRSTFYKNKDNQGTVYIVCGVSGHKVRVGSVDHPAFAYSSNLYSGSLAIDIKDNVLFSVFVDDTGKVRDSFSIIKED